jgi:2-methylcitrate dehydratase PrpD
VTQPASVGPTAALCAALGAQQRRQLPDEVADAARAVVLDGVGCLIAGAAEPAGVIASGYTAAAGGQPEASVAGLADKVDAPAAAFANGVLMHALDFEAVGIPPCHDTSSVFPALLALAERENLSGRDVIRAFVLGWDVECRLRTAGAANSSFHPTAVYGPMAAAAACAVLLGLDPAGIENTLGIAASSAGGLAVNGKSMVKTAHAGNAARTGVTSALLAREGFASASGILERRHGYGDAFLVKPDWERLNQGWSESYFITEPGVNYKPYPVQFAMLNVVDTALDARSAGLDPEDIATVHITASAHIADRSDPRPHSGHAGKFSPEYCTAVALLSGEVGIEAFTDERCADPAVRALIDQCRITAYPEGTGGKRDVALRITRKDGSMVAVERTRPRGSVQDPLTRPQRLAKVRLCLRAVGAEAAADTLIDAMERFDTADDVRALAAALRG